MAVHVTDLIFDFNLTTLLKLETDADKIRLGFSKFVAILLMIMLIGIHMLKIETLRIPKW